MKLIRTGNLTPESSSACGQMKKAAVPRNAISRRVTWKTSGTWTTSRRSFGSITRRTSLRVRTYAFTPLLDWTELNIWEYIQRENIPLIGLYFNRGDGKRYRSLGCMPCTLPVESDASNVDEIVEELRSGKFSNIAERAGRAQDKDDGGGLETLRRGGYM